MPDEARGVVTARCSPFHLLTAPARWSYHWTTRRGRFVSSAARARSAMCFPARHTLPIPRPGGLPLPSRGLSANPGFNRDKRDDRSFLGSVSGPLAFAYCDFPPSGPASHDAA